MHKHFWNTWREETARKT